MKKIFGVVLSLALLLTGCAADAPDSEVTTRDAEAFGEPESVVVITEEVKDQFNAVLDKYKYEGIVYLTHNGEVVYQSASGTNELGKPLTIESPMYVGSVSKHFCATAILILRDQGKLSLDDTLEKYFPEYTIGKDITLKNLLTMRSGIVGNVTPMIENPEPYMDYTAEEISAAIKEWVFSQPLRFEPGVGYEYANSNYMLLSRVVEQVSGQSYADFLRQNVFEPLGMTHSGVLLEVWDDPEWAKGLSFDRLLDADRLKGFPQGAGDVITTAGDMDIWMTALKSGKVISKESFREMTEESSKETGYGYGLMVALRGGYAHAGTIGDYTAYMYLNEEYGYNLYVVTGNTPQFRPDLTQNVSAELLRILYTATDNASK